jgi:hypothetical protein
MFSAGALHPIKSLVTGFDHQLGCPSGAWPGPLATIACGPTAVSPSDLSQRIVHVPPGWPTAWVVLKAHHPLATRSITY